jgi:hypothetical protein
MTALIKKIKSLSKFKLNTLANYAGRFWLNLLSFLLVPVYLHYLGVEAYGLIGAFYAVISFINLLDLGLSTTVSREVALRKAVSDGVSLALPTKDWKASSFSASDFARNLAICSWYKLEHGGIALTITNR